MRTLLRRELTLNPTLIMKSKPHNSKRQDRTSSVMPEGPITQHTQVSNRQPSSIDLTNTPFNNQHTNFNLNNSTLTLDKNSPAVRHARISTTQFERHYNTTHNLLTNTSLQDTHKQDHAPQEIEYTKTARQSIINRSQKTKSYYKDSNLNKDKPTQLRLSDFFPHSNSSLTPQPVPEENKSNSNCSSINVGRKFNTLETTATGKRQDLRIQPKAKRTQKNPKATSIKQHTSNSTSGGKPESTRNSPAFNLHEYFTKKERPLPENHTKITHED